MPTDEQVIKAAGRMLKQPPQLIIRKFNSTPKVDADFVSIFRRKLDPSPLTHVFGLNQFYQHHEDVIYGTILADQEYLFSQTLGRLQHDNGITTKGKDFFLTTQISHIIFAISNPNGWPFDEYDAIVLGGIRL